MKSVLLFLLFVFGLSAFGWLVTRVLGSTVISVAPEMPIIMAIVFPMPFISAEISRLRKK